MAAYRKDLFFSTNRPTREFQVLPLVSFTYKDDSDGTSSMPEVGQNQVTTLHSCALQQHMVPAMVHLICSLYENGDPIKTERLYKKICQQLKTLKLMSPISTIDELAMLQHQFKKGFHRLVSKTRNELQRETRNRSLQGTLTEKVETIFLQPRVDRRLLALPLVENVFVPNRYRDEYEELAVIGEGAYGAVYKVKHKLDSNLYALKLIKFAVKEERVHKVTREVRYLSNLTHNHVVRYYNAWIENDFLFFDNHSSDMFKHSIDEQVVTSEPRALTYTYREPQGLNIDGNQDIDETSDSVQFQMSNPGVAHSSNNSISQRPAQVNGTSENMHSQASQYDSMPDYPDTEISSQKCTLYIQMELCETNLKEWLKKRNDRHSRKECEVDKRENLHILGQILKSVHYVHSKDLIHRDLKPHNIFINSSETSRLEIKLGDFGLSRQIQSTTNSPVSPPTQDSTLAGAAAPPSTPEILSPELLTPHPGGVDSTTGFDWTLYTKGVGTAIYAAPEQLKGNDYDKMSDMYSLGLIAYELYWPFHSEMERRTTLNKLRTEPLPQEFREQWPTESHFIEKLLSTEPNRRPSASDLLSSSLFLSKDQVIKNLCSEQDELKAQNRLLKQELKQKDEELQRKDLEIERLRLQLLTLDERIRLPDQSGMNVHQTESTAIHK